MNAKKIIDFNIYWFLVKNSHYNDRAKKNFFVFVFLVKITLQWWFKIKKKYIKKSFKITLLWWPKNSCYLYSHSPIPKIYIIFIKITLLWMQKKIINFKICWFFGQIITTMLVQKTKKNNKKNIFVGQNHTTMASTIFVFFSLKSPYYGCQIISLISQYVPFLSNTHYNGY